jgi:hypothetical protein
VTIGQRLRLTITDGLDSTLIAGLVTPIVLVAGSPARALTGAAISSVGLGFPRLRRLPAFWFALSVFYGGWFLIEYDRADDHLALAAYWYLAIALSLLTCAKRAVLRANARLLIGATFLLAFVWKLRSPDFISGAFFEFELLTDPRFAPIARWVGGLTAAQLEVNQGLLSAAPATVQLSSSPQVEIIAKGLTFGALLIEPLVALSWFLPLQRMRAARHVTLIAFCFLTYFAVPVAGFGMILLTMAITHAENSRTRKLYFLGMAALFTWSLIWLSLW